MANLMWKNLILSQPVSEAGLVHKYEKKANHALSGNLFHILTAPQKLTLAVLGLGENNFSGSIFHTAYNLYFLLVAVWIAYWFAFYILKVLDKWGINCLKHGEDQIVLNDVDKYGNTGGDVVRICKIVTTMLFLIWAMKFKKLQSLARGVSHPDLTFVTRALNSKRRRDKFQYVAISYLSLICLILTALNDFLLLSIYRSTIKMDQTIAFTGYFFYPVVDMIIAAGIALAVSVYICLTALWSTFNEEIVKATDSFTPGYSSENLLEDITDCYDALTDLTDQAAKIFRFYTTIHAVSVLEFIAVMYTHFFLSHIYSPLLLTVNWVDFIVQFGALCAAACIHRASFVSSENLYKFYKRRTRSLILAVTPAKAWKRFELFYHRVASEGAPINLDVLGIIPLRFSMVGVFIFTAINWIAVCIQFRQEALDEDIGNITTACDSWRLARMAENALHTEP